MTEQDKLFEKWDRLMYKGVYNYLENTTEQEKNLPSTTSMRQHIQERKEAFLAGLSEATNLSQEKALPKIIPIETLTDKEIVARIKNPKQEVKTTMGQLFKIQDDATQAEQSRIIKLIEDEINLVEGELYDFRIENSQTDINSFQAKIKTLQELLSAIKPDEALERIASKPDLEIREFTSEEEKELQKKLSKEKIMVEREKCICEKDCECNCSYCNCLKNKRHFEGTISLGQCCTDTKKDVHEKAKE